MRKAAGSAVGSMDIHSTGPYSGPYALQVVCRVKWGWVRCADLIREMMLPHLELLSK